MKILKELIEHANDTLDEVHEYVRQAYHIHQEHKALADTYIKIAESHISIFNMLHERMVSLIEEEKRKGVQPPAAMLVIWDYEHGKLVDELAHCRVKIEDYKKMNY